jgi:hypothetical protein
MLVFGFVFGVSVGGGGRGDSVVRVVPVVVVTTQTFMKTSRKEGETYCTMIP